MKEKKRTKGMGKARRLRSLFGKNFRRALKSMKFERLVG